MRATQRRRQHYNYSHLPGFQPLLMANVSPARSNLFLLRCDESRRGENRQNHAHAPAGLFGYSRLTGHYPGGQAEYLQVPQFQARGGSALLGDRDGSACRNACARSGLRFFKRYALHSLKSPPTGGALVVVQFS